MKHKFITGLITSVAILTVGLLIYHFTVVNAKMLYLINPVKLGGYIDVVNSIAFAISYSLATMVVIIYYPQWYIKFTFALLDLSLVLIRNTAIFT